MLLFHHTLLSFTVNVVTASTQSRCSQPSAINRPSRSAMTLNTRSQAAASSVGVKLSSYPPDVMRRNLSGKRAAEEGEIRDNMRALTREMIRKGIATEDYDAKMAAQRQKLERSREEFNRRFR